MIWCECERRGRTHPAKEHTRTSATDIAPLLLSQDISMDDDGQRNLTPEQAIDGWREAAAAAGDLDLVEQIDEVGADAVAHEYRRMAEARIDAGRGAPSWLVL